MDYLVLIMVWFLLPLICTILAFALASKADRLRLLHWTSAALVAVCSAGGIAGFFLPPFHPFLKIAGPCYIVTWLATMLQIILFLRPTPWSSRRP